MSKRFGPQNPSGKLSNAHGGPPVIPDKLYFRIGEVAALCRVPSYVLRFWQTEFPQLRPGKSGTGQRLYRRRDVDMALRIKRLLHEEGYTIAGAKGVLAAESSLPPHLRLAVEPPAPAQPTDRDAGPPGDRAGAQLRLVRAELRALLGLLEPRPALKLFVPQAGPSAKTRSGIISPQAREMPRMRPVAEAGLTQFAEAANLLMRPLLAPGPVH